MLVSQWPLILFFTNYNGSSSPAKGDFSSGWLTDSHAAISFQQALVNKPLDTRVFATVHAVTSNVYKDLFIVSSSMLCPDSSIRQLNCMMRVNTPKEHISAARKSPPANCWHWTLKPISCTEFLCWSYFLDILWWVRQLMMGNVYF